MKLNAIPQKSLKFLKSFFGESNNLKWNEITHNTISKEKSNMVQFCIEDLVNQKEYIIMPRFISDGNIEWYALTFTSLQARALKENLNSFVGPTYTNFNGQLTKLNSDDPVDKSVLDFAGPYVYRFNATEKKYNKLVWEALILMRDVLNKQPDRVTKITRPIGRILRDFEEALRLHDGKMANQYITEIQLEGRLTTQNLVFLKIKYFACIEKWKELLLLPQLNTILDIPRPTLITQYIIQAIYKTYLVQFEKENNPEKAVEYFRKNLLTKYKSLFHSRGPLRKPDVLKAFMISLATSENPRKKSLEKILLDCPSEYEDKSYLEALAKLVKIKEQPTKESDYKQAENSYLNGDSDLALQIIATCTPNISSTKLILRCAKDINSLESAKIAISFMNKCSDSEKEEILSMNIFSIIWEELNNLSKTESTTPHPEDIPSNWLEWIIKLNEPIYWPSAVHVAEQAKSEWDCISYLENPLLIENLCEQISLNRTNRNNDLFHNAMPHLVEFFINDGEVHNEFKKLYLKFVELIAYDDQILSSDLEAVYEFTQAILQIGCSKDEYYDLVDCLIGIWDRKESPESLNWGFDLIDALINYSAPDTQIRTDFFIRIIPTFKQHLHRINIELWKYFEQLCKDLNYEEIYNDLQQKIVSDTPSDSQNNIFPNILNNKLIGIYTLDDHVGNRVKAILENSFSGVKVRVDNSHVATASLGSISREADIFLFAWRSAKHSAFDCIEQNRPKNKITLRPAGKGSSSMLRILFEHLGI